MNMDCLFTIYVFFNSFNIILYLKVYKNFTFFVKFTPKSFTPFDNILNGVFLISLLDYSLLLYRRTIDFCMLQLDFFSSDRLPCGLLRFSTHKIMSY